MSGAAAAGLHTVPPPRGRVFHVGRKPNPCYWNTPSRLDLDEPGGARFDDPNGESPTLYCATRPYGALLEKLASLRAIPELPARYDSALEEAPDPDYDVPATLATFRRSYLDTIVMGGARIDADCRCIDAEDPPATSSSSAANRYSTFSECDGSTAGRSRARDRRLTRRVAAERYEIAGREIHGLRYSSVLEMRLRQGRREAGGG